MLLMLLLFSILLVDRVIRFVYLPNRRTGCLAMNLAAHAFGVGAISLLARFLPGTWMKLTTYSASRSHLHCILATCTRTQSICPRIDIEWMRQNQQRTELLQSGG